MPPVDVINLRNNENDLSKNVAIVFVGNAPHHLPGCSISRITDAGDIRSVMKTINSLPEDFAGTLEIIINDPDAMVATRNLAILSLLGYFPDDILAVSAAMHYWFSAFMPYECTAAHGGCFQEVLASDVKRFLLAKSDRVSPWASQISLTTRLSGSRTSTRASYTSLPTTLSVLRRQHRYGRTRVTLRRTTETDYTPRFTPGTESRSRDI